ncbi:MAG: PfkB family carbohydrate kinase, partial [Stellaceae bacterium]
PGCRIVFVCGNFNIVHPGHLRLLNFAADCGDLLVVGVLADRVGSALVKEELRLEGMRSIGVVDYAFILRGPPGEFIARLRPDIVVKGREHESAFNPEQAAVDAYGGRLLFSSGEVQFSSLDLLRHELEETAPSTIQLPRDFPQRHGFAIADLVPLMGKFAGFNVAVIGDLIVDEYVSCEALGMSQEDPTLVVAPIARDRFVGGAGIVAAHARGLGAEVIYLGVAGEDEAAQFAAGMLKKHQVKTVLFTDESRPTTLKQRYRANNKTLLRVSHMRQHDISGAIAARILGQIEPILGEIDLLVFSDFNYGGLPQPLVEAIAERCRGHGVMMVADSQASSQLADVSRFHGMRLLTPTEHEARLAVQDSRSGLVILADALQRKSAAESLLITLGQEGVLIHAPDGKSFLTDRLPAFNTAPKDPAGAGDSLLISA